MVTDEQVRAALRVYWSSSYSTDEETKMRAAIEAAISVSEEKTNQLIKDLVCQWYFNHFEHCQEKPPHDGMCHWPLPGSIKDMPQSEILKILEEVSR